MAALLKLPEVFLWFLLFSRVRRQFAGLKVPSLGLQGRAAAKSVYVTCEDSVEYARLCARVRGYFEPQQSTGSCPPLAGPQVSVFLVPVLVLLHGKARGQAVTGLALLTRVHLWTS